MNKLILLGFILVINLFAMSYGEFAQKYRYETNYEKAVQKAKKTNKEVMFLLVANYCSWCKKFEKRVLAKQEVNTLVHQKFIPLILNKEQKEFPQQFYSTLIPVVYIIDAKTQQSTKASYGYKKASDFLDFLK